MSGAAQDIDNLTSVIRQMIQPAAMVSNAETRPLLQSLKVALPKAADTSFDLPLLVKDITLEDLSRAALLDAIEEGRLVLLLQAGEGRLAIAVPDASLLAGLIEIQTMGTVNKGAATPRTPTRTDAALAEPFFDVLLSEFAHLLGDVAAHQRFVGFSVFRPVDEMRHLPLLLADVEYQVFQAEVDLGQGAKTGQLLLGFPEPPKPKEATLLAEEARRWSETMQTNILQGEVVLDAQLCKIKLQLEEVERLQVGQEFLVPMSALASVKLIGIDGKHAATGKLGQSDGVRAVMLTEGQGLDVAKPQTDRPLSAENPLAALGPDHAPEPISSLLKDQPNGTGAPDDFAEISPPPEESDSRLNDLQELPDLGGEMGSLPDIGELPPLDLGDGLADLPPFEGGSLDDLPMTID